MIEQNEWVFFQDIDWNDPSFNQFNVDTRDFHTGYRWVDVAHKDWNTISKYPDFFFKEDEIKSLIERLYNESGGEGKWRMLDLNTKDHRVNNWNLKYLRIYRTEKGFLICNKQEEAVPKRVFSAPVNIKYLNHH